MSGELQVFDPERFDDVQRIGTGTHASVFVAWDRHLERRVALKVAMQDALVSMLGGERLAELGIAEGLQQLVDELADASRTRYTLLREARLLARVRHPHVIAVLDVGLLDGSPTLVLPYLGGGTLDEQAIEGDWRLAIDLIAKIGEGLAAIHAAGVLHRDFKPSNVLFDELGQPAIADLGLACRFDDAEAMAEWPGTPAYMAPEVLARELRDKRDDVYAFASVAFQMLYGHAPFASAAARSQGRVSEIVREGVPARVRAVLVRGLAAKPEQRWPDMPSLLTALRRATTKRVRRWPAAVLASAGTFVLGAALAVTLADETAWAGACTEAAAELDAVWSPELARELTGALGTRGPSDRIDTWTRRWVHVRASGCAHEHLAPIDPCLDNLRLQLAVTVEILRDPGNRASLDHGALLDELPDPARCVEQPEVAPQGGVLELRRADIELRALIVAGQLEQARERLGHFEDLAREQGSRRELVVIELRRGQLERRRGARDDAERQLTLAYSRAVMLDDDPLAAEAMLELTALASEQGRIEALEQRAMVARAMYQRIDPDRVAEVLELEALGRLASDDVDERGRAIGMLRDALVQRRHDAPADSLSEANLAVVRSLLESSELAELLALPPAPRSGSNDEQLRELLRLRVETLLALHDEQRATNVAAELVRLGEDIAVFVELATRHGNDELASHYAEYASCRSW